MNISKTLKQSKKQIIEAWSIEKMNGIEDVELYSRFPHTKGKVTYE